MSDVRVIIQRDSEREERVVTTGTTAADLFAGERTVIAARVDGELRDLAYAPGDGESVEPVDISSEDGLNILRHSTAHVMAQAVQELFPEAKLGIGPPVKGGFYYDFDVAEPFTPEDLKRVEKKMQEIQKRGQRFSRRVTTDEDARVELADEPYKLELIGLKGNAAQAADGADAEVGGGELTIYDNLDAKTGELCWKDLCRGPHLPTTRNIPAFKLMRSAAAYWRGSEKNPQLQRIYGTAWPSKEELKAHLEFLAEAEKRDHRKLGTELDLFSFPDELGPGLAVFHPKGGVVRKEMETYSRRRHEDAGYEFVNTPHISKEQLFETSGHLPNYAEGMFPPIEFDGQNYRLKAMNCPMHNLIFKGRGRSYRELPLRLFEFGTVYRYEKSGVVHGLTRSRGFTQDDSHIYCTKEQMPQELDSLLTFVLDLLRDYGLNQFELELSTRDPESDKFIGEDAEWEEATEALRQAAEKQGLPLVPDPGGAAYYGPKISVQARDAIGRSWQMSTIQVDFQQPKRFGLEYTAADGSRQQPVMIHRALFGSIERFFAVLLEHYAGAFPAWLAPVQAVGIPIGDAHVSYLQEFAADAKARGLRVEVDASSDRMQKKIRNHQKAKVPFMIIVGDEDMNAGTVSFRYRDGSQENGIAREDAIAKLLDVVERRVQV
ncbi:threonine--tRNA ligase [Streptomyces diastaticus]|uniref:Threonine--tRNA ligase n=4 Tax=Streptomyces TaxID=1883 RepID=A0A6A0CXI7_9ACTN|nr:MULTISPECIES: threonine--tRNA ligase [unclassified Streptomyces]NEE32377.1 threonine--tRNA ligase [Streptomyces sp. SID7982]NEE55670.1 threonine--tRNA ligase [Streptomyces sp. SID8455]QNE80323.1 threonine--tRNA ligase [Streptomyces rutgersensis]RPK80745.1 Threonine--tRNA ligase [Streptomyces sp. ADI98-12]SUP36228.1 Threonyl-tRNA synthetase [Streptomyces griseus]GFH72032.1 threonine--tRNA ligase [Streptomyces diastaticus subsp. diastaticus]GFH76401.1 threonine--tRNA ligase [Streptomyces go